VNVERLNAGGQGKIVGTLERLNVETLGAKTGYHGWVCEYA